MWLRLLLVSPPPILERAFARPPPALVPFAPTAPGATLLPSPFVFRDPAMEVVVAALPAAVVAWGEPYDSPLWEGRVGPGEAGKAFVCRDYACQAPTRDAAMLASQLTA